MSADGRHAITWLDAQREPTCPPDPNFPAGKDVILVVDGGLPSCKVDLPYPAKRIGTYVVKCRRCRLSFAVTTAGRPDDPKSVTINCSPSLTH